MVVCYKTSVLFTVSFSCHDFISRHSGSNTFLELVANGVKWLTSANIGVLLLLKILNCYKLGVIKKVLTSFLKSGLLRIVTLFEIHKQLLFVIHLIESLIKRRRI